MALCPTKLNYHLKEKNRLNPPKIGSSAQIIGSSAQSIGSEIRTSPLLSSELRGLNYAGKTPGLEGSCKNKAAL
jgi:hypothetical protein